MQLIVPQEAVPVRPLGARGILARFNKTRYVEGGCAIQVIGRIIPHVRQLMSPLREQKASVGMGQGALLLVNVCQRWRRNCVGTAA